MAKSVQERIYLTPTETSLHWALRRKRLYYVKKKKLAPDGSFFCTDANLAEELHGRSTRTIQRCKRGLQSKGLIDFIPGKHEGQATRYWVQEHDKMSTSQKGEHDISSKKRDILSVRDGQNVPPVNYIATDKANSAGSALACQGQALPASVSTMVKGYIGQTINKHDLKYLLNFSPKVKEEILAAIQAGQVLLEDGIILDEIIDPKVVPHEKVKL